MNQYYICCADESGQDYSQDLLVLASSHDEAIKLWVEYFEEPEDFASTARSMRLPVKSIAGVYGSPAEMFADERTFAFDRQSGVWA